MSKSLKPARWDDLRVLLAVLRAGSFSSAADALGVEQSTVSRRIASLEAELGHLLFDRTPTGPAPTGLAERMASHAEQMERQAQRIADLADGQQGAVQGRVRLAVTESFAVHVFLPRLYGPLRQAYPDLAIDLVSSSASADLGQREADLAVRFYRSSQGDLITRRVARLPVAPLATRAYAAGRPADPEALDWVVLDLGNVTSPDGRFLAEHVRRPPSMLTSSHLLQVEAVRGGHGVALLARAHLALDPQLTTLELGLPEAPPVEVWLAAPSSLRPTPRVDALWTFLSERLTELEAV